MKHAPTLLSVLATTLLALPGCDADPADASPASAAQSANDDLEHHVQALLDEADAAEWDLDADAPSLEGPDEFTAETPSSGNLLRALILEFAKGKVVEISEANTERRDNLEEVRLQLLPYIAILAVDFAANRPVNEVELTQRTWKNLWDDSADLDPEAGVLLDRNNIYQVVEDGYYYNVSNNVFSGPEGGVPLQSFLKGNYELARPATEENEGQFALNVIDLEFSANVARPGVLPLDRPLQDLVLEVDAFVTTGEGAGIPPFEVPGPIGVTGTLFNLYVDDELRIALGVGDQDGGASEEPALFILSSAEFAGPPTL